MFARPGLFLFGLTGGVASGKSTVGRILRGFGVHVIDADVLARRAVEPGQPALVEIAAAFPGVVVGGALDRAALGRVVFGDPSALARLNAIVHPRVAASLQEELDQLGGVAPGAAATGAGVHAVALRVAAYEVPLLFENSLDQWLRPTVLVACDEAVQVTRAMGRNGWSREHAVARIAAQMPLSDKRKRADYVIDNSADLAALEVNTRGVLDLLLAAASEQFPQRKADVSQ